MLADDATFYLEFSILTLKGVYLIVYTLGIEINFMTRSFQTTYTHYVLHISNEAIGLQISIFPTFYGRCFWLLIFGKKISNGSCLGFLMIL